MKESKYIDTNAIMQVIGCVFNDNTLLNLEDKYPITDNDFCNDFRKNLLHNRKRNQAECAILRYHHAAKANGGGMSDAGMARSDAEDAG